jgi:SET domain-containing protein
MPGLCYVQQAGYGVGNSLDNSRIKQRRDSVMKYVIKDSPLHGLGVFAAEDLPSGSTIERCAYIVIDDDDLQEVNRLNDYLFTSPDDPGDYLCVMGAGMLYNHSDTPNAAWEIDDDDNRLLRFYTTSDVAAGDELLHDYGSEYWTTRE